jgi:polygalacturonase
VILRDSSTWTIPIRQSDRVTVENVKLLGYRANSDGIDICNCRDVTVDGAFRTGHFALSGGIPLDTPSHLS